LVCFVAFLLQTHAQVSGTTSRNNNSRDRQNLSETILTPDPIAGQLSSSAVSVSPTYFGFPGPAPSISANGTTDAIVWVLQPDKYGAGSATLHAYDATNIGTELYKSSQNSKRDDPGGAVKFTVPTVANGKVYVPAVQRFTVYGLRK
jgi:hypothetical protein